MIKSENIIYPGAEECGKTVRLVIK